MSITVPLEGFGGGSNPLNFKVVGNPQPENPKENTIWVNTDVPITGWIFSATEPEAPVEGMVWFTTGTASTAEFNALKKNGLMVYPVSAKQYISGAWVVKDAQIYKAGQWKKFRMYLYDNGIEYPDTAKFVASSGGGAVNFNDSNITVKPQNIKAANGKWAYTDKNMDLSQLNTLVMMLSGSTSYGGKCGFGVAPITPSGTAPATSAFTSIRTKTEQENINGTYFCDISSVNSGYVFFGGAKTETNHDSGGGSISMNECYLF